MSRGELVPTPILFDCIIGQLMQQIIENISYSILLYQFSISLSLSLSLVLLVHIECVRSKHAVGIVHTQQGVDWRH
jgi:hypothetical protein